MKIETRAIPGFLKAPDPAARAILVYGPDEGLVRERAQTLARSVVEDLHDPFRVVELTGPEIEREPDAFIDAAAQIALGGGRRLLRVRVADGDIADVLAAWLADPRGDAVAVIEAGDLKGSSALVKLATGADNAAAIACYHDEARDLGRIIADTLAARQVRLDRDAAEWLVGRLGGDRQVTRGEIEKLALYVGAGGTVTLDAARAVVGDSADIGLDNLIHAVAGREPEAALRSLDRLLGQGVAPVVVLRALSRHFMRLHQAAALMAAGQPAEAAMARLRPPVFWKDKVPMAAQLKRWPARDLAAAVDRLLAAEIRAKSSGQPAELIAERAALDLVQTGGR